MKAGQCHCWMWKSRKSTTFPRAIRSARFPAAPPRSRAQPRASRLGRFGKPQIRDNADGKRDGECGQDEGGEGSGVGEESECGAGVFHQHEPEKRQDADGVFRQRGREDDSLGREIQDENNGGDRHPEEELGRGFHCGEGGVNGAFRWAQESFHRASQIDSSRFEATKRLVFTKTGEDPLGDFTL